MDGHQNIIFEALYLIFCMEVPLISIYNGVESMLMQYIGNIWKKALNWQWKCTILCVFYSSNVCYILIIFLFFIGFFFHFIVLNISYFLNIILGLAVQLCTTVNFIKYSILWIKKINIFKLEILHIFLLEINLKWNDKERIIINIIYI